MLAETLLTITLFCTHNSTDIRSQRETQECIMTIGNCVEEKQINGIVDENFKAREVNTTAACIIKYK